jgi:adenine-specific DNA methylase
LTWGALNIIGSSPERRSEIERSQERVAKSVDAEITKLGIEHDKQGNRAKSYLYCLEARCPETGWLIPLSPTWVISKGRNVIARLTPDHRNKRFDIEIVTGVSDKEAAAADQGTVQDGDMVTHWTGRPIARPSRRCVATTEMPIAALAIACVVGRNPISSRSQTTSFRSGSTLFTGSSRNRWQKRGRNLGLLRRPMPIGNASVAWIHSSPRT